MGFASRLAPLICRGEDIFIFHSHDEKATKEMSSLVFSISAGKLNLSAEESLIGREGRPRDVKEEIKIPVLDCSAPTFFLDSVRGVLQY